MSRRRGRNLHLGHLALSAGIIGLTTANHLLSRQAEHRTPPTGRFVEADGARLHYLDKGEGPVIVLLHGIGSYAGEMELSGLPDLLARNYRVLVFDRPGYGYSERPRGQDWTAERQAQVLWAALDALGVRRAIFAGQSWGCLVALEAALGRPEQTAGLVLMSGYFFPTRRPDVAMLGSTAAPGVGDVTRETVLPWVGRLLAPPFYHALFAPGRPTRRFREGFRTDLAMRPSQLRATTEDAAHLNPSAARLVGRYRDIRTPTLLIASREDHVAAFRRHSVQAVRAIPGSRLVAMSGGHMLHHVRPAAVAAAIDSFALELPPQAPPPAD